MLPDGSTHSTQSQPDWRVEPGQTLSFEPHEQKTLPYETPPESANESLSLEPSTTSQEFDNFTILERISGGGSGAVFKAKDRLGRIWAIKVLRDDRLSEDQCKRFFIEAQKMQALKHPHLLEIQDYRIFEGRPFLILPLCQESFFERILSGKLSIRSSVRLMMDATKGLSFLHEQGYVHRDIKPGNLLIDQNGKAIVADLGLLQQAEPTEHNSSEGKSTFVPGTIPYMKPEVLAGLETKANPTWDIHACGVTLYQMLSGRRPPICDSPVDYLHKSREEAIPPLSTELKKVPKSLDKIIARCCAKQGGYANAQQLHKALSSWYFRWYTRSVIMFVMLLFFSGAAVAAMLPPKPKPVIQPTLVEVLEKQGEVTLIDDKGYAVYPPKIRMNKKALAQTDEELKAYSIDSVDFAFIELCDKLPEGAYTIEGDFRLAAQQSTQFHFGTGFRTEKLADQSEAYIYRGFSFVEPNPMTEGSIRGLTQLLIYPQDDTIHSYTNQYPKAFQELPKKAFPSWHNFVGEIDNTSTSFSVNGVKPLILPNTMSADTLKGITRTVPQPNPFLAEYNFGAERPIGFVLKSGSVDFRNVKITRKK